MKKIITLIITISITLTLFLGLCDMPEFGAMDNPTNNELYRGYVENTSIETGAVNVVTGVILDYRAFDTLIEASVIFITCVVLMMVFMEGNKGPKGDRTFFDNTVLKEMIVFIIPATQIFGIYLIINGHLSPGGGFSGGAIIAVSLVLTSIYVKNTRANNQGFNQLTKGFDKIIAFALMIYAGLKGMTFVLGNSHGIDFHIPLGQLGNIISGGLLLPLNILVGVIVALSLFTIIDLFEGEVVNEHIR